MIKPSVTPAIPEPIPHLEVTFRNLCKFLRKLASRKGVEPLTPGLGNLCSILLSYRDPQAFDAGVKTARTAGPPLESRLACFRFARIWDIRCSC